MRELDLLLLFVPFVHRKIDDPGEFEPILVDELELLADFRAREPSEFAKLGRIARHEEGRVARLEAERQAHRLDAFRANVVGERPAPAHPGRLRVGLQRGLVLGSIEKQNVSEPRLSLALRPCVHAIGKSPLASAGSGNGPNFVFLDLEQPGEHFETRPAEMLRHVLHDERIAEVRLVRPVFAHRFGIRNARPGRRRDRLAAGEFLERAAYDRLHRVENVALLDKAHFDIELIKLARQTVGARVLVAETGRDLEIAVETRHHQELLVLLRRLGKRIELARVQARGHEEVARAFRARGREDRGLEFEEPLPLHSSAQRINDLTAQHDVLV